MSLGCRHLRQDLPLLAVAASPNQKMDRYRQSTRYTDVMQIGRERWHEIQVNDERWDSKYRTMYKNGRNRSMKDDLTMGERGGSGDGSDIEEQQRSGRKDGSEERDAMVDDIIQFPELREPSQYTHAKQRPFPGTHHFAFPLRSAGGPP